MKNKTVKMVLAVVVLGVCCGAYAGVKTYVAHQDQKESEEDSEESIQRQHLKKMMTAG